MASNPCGDTACRGKGLCIIRKRSDFRNWVIDDRQENLNVPFGSLADLFGKFSLMSAFGGEADIGSSLDVVLASAQQSQHAIC